uniref:Uncharacterized protein n=1 Tax=Vespula pensylvanica TaxID=30213 RepID=A0A834PDH1_VESPE|nr:hypothetical protein H0235_000028 [Vespula pensylvanica]
MGDRGCQSYGELRSPLWRAPRTLRRDNSFAFALVPVFSAVARSLVALLRPYSSLFLFLLEYNLNGNVARHVSLCTLAFGRSTDKVRTIRIIGGKQKQPRPYFNGNRGSSRDEEEEEEEEALPAGSDIKRGRVLPLTGVQCRWPVDDKVAQVTRTVKPKPVVVRSAGRTETSEPDESRIPRASSSKTSFLLEPIRRRAQGRLLGKLSSS